MKFVKGSVFFFFFKLCGACLGINVQMTGQMFLQGVFFFFLFNQVSWFLHNKFVAELETSLNIILHTLATALDGQIHQGFQMPLDRKILV